MHVSVVYARFVGAAFHGLRNPGCVLRTQSVIRTCSMRQDFSCLMLLFLEHRKKRIICLSDLEVDRRANRRRFTRCLL
jgi:hypothetical protein